MRTDTDFISYNGLRCPVPTDHSRMLVHGFGQMALGVPRSSLASALAIALIIPCVFFNISDCRVITEPVESFTAAASLPIQENHPLPIKKRSIDEPWRVVTINPAPQPSFKVGDFVGYITTPDQQTTESSATPMKMTSESKETADFYQIYKSVYNNYIDHMTPEGTAATVDRSPLTTAKSLPTQENHPLPIKKRSVGEPWRVVTIKPAPQPSFKVGDFVGYITIPDEKTTESSATPMKMTSESKETADFYQIYKSVYNNYIDHMKPGGTEATVDRSPLTTAKSLPTQENHPLPIKKRSIGEPWRVVTINPAPQPSFKVGDFVGYITTSDQHTTESSATPMKMTSESKETADFYQIYKSVYNNYIDHMKSGVTEATVDRSPLTTATSLSTQQNHPHSIKKRSIGEPWRVVTISPSPEPSFKVGDFVGYITNPDQQTTESSASPMKMTSEGKETADLYQIYKSVYNNYIDHMTPEGTAATVDRSPLTTAKSLPTQENHPLPIKKRSVGEPWRVVTIKPAPQSSFKVGDFVGYITTPDQQTTESSASPMKMTSEGKETADLYQIYKSVYNNYIDHMTPGGTDATVDRSPLTTAKSLPIQENHRLPIKKRSVGAPWRVVTINPSPQPSFKVGDFVGYITTPDQQTTESSATPMKMTSESKETADFYQIYKSVYNNYIDHMTPGGTDATVDRSPLTTAKSLPTQENHPHSIKKRSVGAPWRVVTINPSPQPSFKVGDFVGYITNPDQQTTESSATPMKMTSESTESPDFYQIYKSVYNNYIDHMKPGGTEVSVDRSPPTTPSTPPKDNVLSTSLSTERITAHDLVKVHANECNKPKGTNNARRTRSIKDTNPDKTKEYAEIDPSLFKRPDFCDSIDYDFELLKEADTTPRFEETTTPHFIEDYENDYDQLNATIITSTTHIPTTTRGFPYRGIVTARCEKDDEGKMFADPSRCRRYFKCEQGFFTLYKCPGMMTFSNRINDCHLILEDRGGCSLTFLGLGRGNWRTMMSLFYRTTSRPLIKARMVKDVTPMSQVTYPTELPYITETPWERCRRFIYQKNLAMMREWLRSMNVRPRTREAMTEWINSLSYELFIRSQENRRNMKNICHYYAKLVL